MRLAAVTVVVDDYDEAIAHFVHDLGFVLREDTPLGDGKRWVVVSPDPQHGAALLLARASSPEQAAVVGRQCGGRVGFFLHTESFDADHERLLRRGVAVVDGPRSEEYGRVLVFRDRYGNRWDLIEPVAP